MSAMVCPSVLVEQVNDLGTKPPAAGGSSSIGWWRPTLRVLPGARLVIPYTPVRHPGSFFAVTLRLPWETGARS
jgi:hypothetical protein